MTIPHSIELRNTFAEYLEDLGVAVSGFLDGAQKDTDLQGLFKSCTAGYCVMSSFARNDFELVNAAAGAVRRTLVLACLHQISLTAVELRRLVELVAWFIYFIDHPVEWEEFASNPNAQIETSLEAPIRSCAHQSLRFYLRYARELFDREGCQVGVDAIETLSTQYGELSQDIHAASNALLSTNTLALAFDSYDRRIAARTRERAHATVRASCIALASTEPRLLSRLGGIERGWFDWLVGRQAARTFRGEFGIARANSPPL